MRFLREKGMFGEADEIRKLRAMSYSQSLMTLTLGKLTNNYLLQTIDAAMSTRYSFFVIDYM